MGQVKLRAQTSFEIDPQKVATEFYLIRDDSKSIKSTE